MKENKESLLKVEKTLIELAAIDASDAGSDLRDRIAALSLCALRST
jgi:hypothetical protein